MSTEIAAGIVLALILTAATKAKDALTWPAVLAADIMLILICIMSGLREAVFIIGMYVSVFCIDMIFKKRSNKKHKRKLAQILANGTAACICIIFYKMTGSIAFLLAYYTSIYEVLADSIASDVGVLSKREPRDICTMKKVPAGLSGGVSLLGLSSSLASCMCAGIITALALSLSTAQCLTVIAVPYLCMLLDSVIGSRIQVKYICTRCGTCTEQHIHCGKEARISSGIHSIDNSMVNFICTAASAALGFLAACAL